MDKRLEVVATVGKIKTLKELEEYFNSLDVTLQNNVLLSALFEKRRNNFKNKK